MDTFKFPVCVFLIVVCVMGIPTHAQTASTVTMISDDATATSMMSFTEGTTEAGTELMTTPVTSPGIGSTDGVSTQATTGGVTSDAPSTSSTERKATSDAVQTTGGRATSDASSTRPTGVPTTPATTTKPPPRKEFEGEIRILTINGTEADFSAGNYEDPNSMEYMDLSGKLCNAVEAAVNDSIKGGSLVNCSVTKFTKGSIVATFRLGFLGETGDISTELTQILKDAFTTSTDPRINILEVDTSSIKFSEGSIPGETTPRPTAKVTTETPRKDFEGEMKIEEINGTKADFNAGDYGNSNSQDYKELSEDVCTAVETAVKDSNTGKNLENCKVTKFASGSIVATFELGFPVGTGDISKDLIEVLQGAFTNSTDPRINLFKVDTSSITLKEVSKTTVAPNPDPEGLSPGAIAGIVVGSVAAVAVVVVIVVVFAVKSKRESAKVGSLDEEELRPTSRQSKQADQNSNSSA
ncbi:uncharacterized protein LOC110979306 isoform X2 [Acanthaster planci]|uniref:Uncharacterized protein LOC110979306 isoform X1 n=1 Tax=Acanthaster planci TaxID=133434 RepID=A0A8B7YE58_ACAPL|nr:uncharacterized protein LOC110979306 isoform X1 [Acanthaster planci]XP_022090681.1 uncharacterized protein LOC110979306 isoform X2 [Acanthaster planci]